MEGMLETIERPNPRVELCLSRVLGRVDPVDFQRSVDAEGNGQPKVKVCIGCPATACHDPRSSNR